MTRLIVSLLLLIPSLVQARPTKKVCYLFGPCVVTADMPVMQAYCMSRATVHDDGTPIKDSKSIGACYNRLHKTVWLSHDRPWSIKHELCHHYCNNAKDIPECDRKCAKVH